jgi:hypothetical protein
MFSNVTFEEPDAPILGFCVTSYVSSCIHGVISQKTCTFTPTTGKTADITAGVFVFYLTALYTVLTISKMSNGKMTVDNKLKRLGGRPTEEKHEKYQNIQCPLNIRTKRLIARYLTYIGSFS